MTVLVVGGPDYHREDVVDDVLGRALARATARGVALRLVAEPTLLPELVRVWADDHGVPVHTGCDDQVLELAELVLSFPGGRAPGALLATRASLLGFRVGCISLGGDLRW